MDVTEFQQWVKEQSVTLVKSVKRANFNILGF